MSTKDFDVYLDPYQAKEQEEIALKKIIANSSSGTDTSTTTGSSVEIVRW